MHNVKNFKQKKNIKNAKKFNNFKFENFNVHIAQWK
jgi:hypothetical protein